MPNALINETSPYLLQHADNPVAWQPWSQEVFARARLLDKPVLVSIGYAACHWCHVMAHESFEQPEIARVMNDLFICVKVDREERPDVDGIYMQAVQALTGHGGWPLNVFLTPDGRPFYGGTYFPPDDRRGMPAWPRVLEAVADAYRNRKGDIQRNAELLTRQLRATAEPPQSVGEPTLETLENAHAGIVEVHDADNGGFGRAPKFPHAMVLEFLLRVHARTGNPQPLEVVKGSLEAMARGGIYDHLGGGFHRYSVDDSWLVPHFEKMLYDNGLLASVYVQAYQVTGDDFFKRVARETLDYVLRSLRHPEGGFFSSQDADSEGHEGKHYVWTPDEIEAALGEDGARAFNAYYGVTRQGNFEGKNILHTRDNPEAARPGNDAPFERVRASRERLLNHRFTRIPPGTDDKVLTGWNALALRALAEAAAAFDDARYSREAERNAGFLLEHLYVNGRLLRTWKDGRARLKGYLEDYALLVNALISLHEATFGHRWLREASRLTDEMLRLFWDEEAGVLYDVGADHERLVVRPREYTDNAVPSGSAAAAEALVRLGRITGDAGLTRKAVRLFQGITPLIARYPLSFGNWLKALELHLAPSTEVAIIGARASEDTRGLQRTLFGRYHPNRVFVGWDPSEREPIASPVLEGREMVRGRATAYVCHAYACSLPTTDPAVLERQLRA
ncbi:MAG: thioredoxin domain-containing protein [SAR202 cluster bacterium]|nr:thioredoxin domain-containing protein [SAR202 cluster bacterium]